MSRREKLIKARLGIWPWPRELRNVSLAYEWAGISAVTTKERQ
jgi:hypothetical protein